MFCHVSRLILKSHWRSRSTQAPHTDTYAHTHVHTHTRTHTHTHTHTHASAHTHTHIHMYTHMYTHIHTHARTHTHTHICTHTHTHTHTGIIHICITPTANCCVWCRNHSLSLSSPCLFLSIIPRSLSLLLA